MINWRWQWTWTSLIDLLLVVSLRFKLPAAILCLLLQCITWAQHWIAPRILYHLFPWFCSLHCCLFFNHFVLWLSLAKDVPIKSFVVRELLNANILEVSLIACDPFCWQIFSLSLINLIKGMVWPHSFRVGNQEAVIRLGLVFLQYSICTDFRVLTALYPTYDISCCFGVPWIVVITRGDALSWIACRLYTFFLCLFSRAHFILMHSLSEYAPGLRSETCLGIEKEELVGWASLNWSVLHESW